MEIMWAAIPCSMIVAAAFPAVIATAVRRWARDYWFSVSSTITFMILEVDATFTFEHF